MSPKRDWSKGTPEPIHLLNKIKELDNGEPLVDIRVVAPSVRMFRPSVIPYVRQTVAEMCEKAAQALPKGMYLGLVEGWRPIERQQRIYDHIYACAVEAYPERNHTALRRTVCRWVAPTDQKAPPGHCTGAAVDVWLIDENNEVIDISSPYERFQAAATFSLGLSETALRNRMALYDAMMGVGFSNCRDEWWHYSYGDAGYSVRMHQDSCVYGLAKLPLELYEKLELEHIEAMKVRINPFLPPKKD